MSGYTAQCHGKTPAIHNVQFILHYVAQCIAWMKGVLIAYDTRLLETTVLFHISKD